MRQKYATKDFNMNLIDKVKRRERLSLEEATALYDLDLFTLGELADERRRELHGKQTYFNINRHINPTNICKDVCKFCAYSSSRKNPNPYTMNHDEILAITYIYDMFCMNFASSKLSFKFC